ncbi:large ribosomal subunit protein uL23m [Trichomonascus vanleenenianus]|uniref:mitochondrial 54S ribosomal protein uL23m MRP20 n=1 Tax=Trichomonascus vanleenenianus TaxID=2268995 RepID=UPI003ECB9BDF
MPRSFRLLSAKKIARITPPQPYIPKTIEAAAPKPVEQAKGWVERTKPTAAEEIFRRTQEALKTDDKPHFRVGGKEIYFPQAKIVLLRPSAKHSPFQAKFIVPRNFNKLDLRDYLWHVYGLRALNVTTQLMFSKWDRARPNLPRHRTPQIKKMTIEMEDPFIWPEPLTKEEQDKEFQINLHEEMRKYAEDIDRIGSNKLRPPRAFGGIVGPYVPAAEPFVPKTLKSQMINKKNAAEYRESQRPTEELVKKHLGL